LQAFVQRLLKIGYNRVMKVMEQVVLIGCWADLK
jgi:DNA segregation ATPase FtsK/SpoIIIE-like protein